ncbi:MAG: hypothetical protein GYA36_19010 [Veillonellaceae bacterium]|nr:hypothetical protein [Veillonellaceae bacterium]
MGKYARKVKRAAQAPGRKATKKAIIKTAKQQEKIQAFRRNAAKTVKEKMIKQAIQKAMEGAPLEEPPGSISTDGSIAVPNPAPPRGVPEEVE